MIFKIEAEGDTTYIKAADEDEAYFKLKKIFGEVPRRMLTFTVVEKNDVPEEEEVL